MLVTPASSGLDLIRSVPIFSSLPDEAAGELLAVLSRREAACGETLFRHGDAGDSMYFIERGALRIHVPDSEGRSVTLADLGPGAFFGEMAVLCRTPRSASATVTADAVLLVLPAAAALAVLTRNPAAALEVARVSAERLEHTDAMLRQRVSRNLNEEDAACSSLADRMADRIAEFGGSWTFIFGSLAVFLLWIVLNTWAFRSRAFDPFPYVFLNLLLGIVTGLQAPIIMMAQNRQNEKDRRRADLDYKVNLKNEMALDELLRRFAAVEAGLRQAPPIQNGKE